MYELIKILERQLRVNFLKPGPRFIKKNLPGRGLTKVEKHWTRQYYCGTLHHGLRVRYSVTLRRVEWLV